MNRNECMHSISENVIRFFGLHFPENRWNDLERLVSVAGREAGVSENLEAISEWLSQRILSTKDLNILSEHLRVGETYFFREKAALSLMREVIIPQIINERQGKKHIRIWSAGCSSGEEAYTLAMLLLENIADLKKWDITILATDISLLALNKAIEGKYTSWSFRETDQALKDKYFIPHEKDWEIIPEIRKMVTFSRLNLADSVYDPVATNTNNMDVIFCRNVLMYFTPKKARAAGKRFFNALVDNGWFVSSQVELSEDYFEPFARVYFGNGIFYQKSPKTTLSLKTSRHELPYEPIVSIKSEPLKPVPSKDHKTKNLIRKAQRSENKFIVFADAEKLYAKGQYQQCVDQCRTMYDKDPNGFKYLLLIVKSYANMGRLEDAKNWGTKLTANNTTSVEAYHFLATVLLELGELESAETALKKALYLDRDNLQVLLTMGNVLKRQGKKQFASKCFKNMQNLLSFREEEELVPGFEGLTVGRVKAMVEMSIR